MAVAELLKLDRLKELLDINPADGSEDTTLTHVVAAAQGYVVERVRLELTTSVDPAPAPTPPPELFTAAEMAAMDFYDRQSSAGTAAEVGLDQVTRPIGGRSFTIRQLLARYRRPVVGT